jgi:hypothetical protein
MCEKCGWRNGKHCEHVYFSYLHKDHNASFIFNGCKLWKPDGVLEIEQEVSLGIQRAETEEVQRRKEEGI